MNIEKTITGHVITALEHAGCMLAAVDDGEQRHATTSAGPVWDLMTATEYSTLCFKILNDPRTFWILINPYGQEDCLMDGSWPQYLDTVVWGAYNDALDTLDALSI